MKVVAAAAGAALALTGCRDENAEHILMDRTFAQILVTAPFQLAKNESMPAFIQGDSICGLTEKNPMHIRSMATTVQAPDGAQDFGHVPRDTVARCASDNQCVAVQLRHMPSSSFKQGAMQTLEVTTLTIDRLVVSKAIPVVRKGERVVCLARPANEAELTAGRMAYYVSEERAEELRRQQTVEAAAQPKETAAQPEETAAQPKETAAQPKETSAQEKETATQEKVELIEM